MKLTPSVSRLCPQISVHSLSIIICFVTDKNLYVRFSIVSISKPSEAVERLLTRRKNSHENALEDMRNELSAAHEKCASELRERSERIKIEIDRIRKKIEEYQDKIQKPDLSTLSGKKLQATWDSITTLLTEEKKAIDEFHNNLRDIERNRQFRVKRVMQKCYEIFYKISHISPFEIQTLLENEIQDYNETVLRNFKVYEDLHMHMIVLADSRSQELQNWLEDINDRRRDEICLENMRRLIRKKETLEKPEEMFIYDPDGQLARFELTTKLDLTEEIIKNWQSKIVIFDESSVTDCSKQLGEALAELKASIAKLVVSYELGLQKLSDKYENEVGEMKEDKNCVLENDVKLLDEAVHSLQDCYKIIAAKFEDLCNHHLRAIEATIDEFSRFLRDFNSSWKKQASRLLELQETIGRVVDDLSAKSQKNLGELEKKLNSYSQQLRQATSEEKMKQQLPQIFTTLELISEKYKSTYDDECKAIKDYTKTVFNEVPKMIKQFNEILESHGYRDTLVTDAEEFKTESSQDEPNLVKQQLRFCENLIAAILYWKSTLMNEIVEFLKNFPTIVEDAAKTWQDTILSQRSAVLQIKLDSNSERREQVQTDIYNVRVQEIEEHTMRLKNHEVKVNQILKETNDCLEEFLCEQKQSMQICDSRIVETSEKIFAARSTTELKRLQKEVESSREDYKNETEQTVKVHREELRNILDSLMNENDNFLQDIQLFKDGGNFSTDEVKSYRKSLATYGKTISKSQTTNMQKFDKVIGELDRAIEKLFKTTLEKFNMTMRELKFYEDSRKAITKCAVIIERQVHRLLEDDTIFVNAVVDRIEQPCEISNSKILADETAQILESLDSRLDNLIVAFPTVKANTAQDTVKSRRKSTVSSKKKKQKLPNKMINYSSLFISSEETLTRDNCFSVIAMNTMIKTIEQIQADAMKFFTTTSKRTETEASYHEYMEHILQRFNYYREQLENLWRQEVQDLLAAAAALEKSIRECILASFDDFHNRRIGEMKTTIEKKLDALDEAMRVWSTQRDDMFSSFKVLHGNPGTRDSLDKLTDKVVQEEEQMQNSVIEKLIEFKRDSEELASFYEISLLEVANPLKKIASKLKDRAKRQRLKDLLEERNRSDLPVSTEVPDALDIAETSNRRSPKCKRKFSSRGADSLNIEFLLNDLVERAKRTYNSAFEEAETSVNNFLQAGEEFKQRWKSNMDIVAQVYQITLYSE